MRVLVMLIFIFTISSTFAWGSAEKCFLISPYQDFQPTTPQERLCLGEINPETKKIQIRLLWGDEEVAIFKYNDLSFEQQANKVDRALGVSNFFNPALNAFFLRMVGTLNNETKTESGEILIGNQLKKSKLYYKSE